MKRLGLIAAIAAASLLAGCGAKTGLNASLPPSPENPGTQIKFVNPNPQKWTDPIRTAGQQPRPGAPRIYLCKPLACAGNAGVSITTTPSPTRNPDRAALEKAAKLLPTQVKAQDLMMEAASEGDERQTALTSKVSEARGYPAIVAEVKRTTRGKARYIMRGDLFVGLMLVKVVSLSTTREEAKKNFDEFVNALEISDFERQPVTAQGEPRVSGGAEEHPAFSGVR